MLPNQKAALAMFGLFTIIGLVISHLRSFYSGFIQGSDTGDFFGPGERLNGDTPKIIGYAIIFFGIFLGAFIWFLPS